MKNLNSGSEVIHKEVVVIGNGPSGISLSAMLSGLGPHLVSREHPDEMLSARLSAASTQCSLAQQSTVLGQLASGLEGRTTNPISLLLDALEHPCADLGLEMAPLVHWRRQPEHQIDHIVLGKGPPGGSWHTMDPNVLTLSLGSWMALPGLPYSSVDVIDSQHRASAGSVAKYYENYVTEMQLSQYFQSNVTVTRIDPINQHQQKTKPSKDCDTIDNKKKCSFVNALNFIRSRTKCHKTKSKEQNCSIRTCKRPRDNISRHDMSPNRKVRELIDRSYFSVDQSVYFSIPRDSNVSKSKFRSLSFNDSDTSQICDKLSVSPCDSSLNIPTCKFCPCYKKNISMDDSELEIFSECLESQNIPSSARWLVSIVDTTTGTKTIYSCNNLVLATGASDLPNRLGLPAETYDLSWVLHDLRTLEQKLDALDKRANDSSDPVLVVGAGLSAADAVIATRFRSIPVLHVFRNRSVSLDKQLPENMYPEYHKVHQMMLDGGSTYPLYTALPEHTVTEINSSDKTITLVSKSGVPTNYKVSFVVILIGSRPDLTFLPTDCSLGVKKSQPVDAKSNPVDINKLTHSVNGYEGLYAIGPLAGDNFVRFIPGGALAIVSDLYKNKNW